MREAARRAPAAPMSDVSRPPESVFRDLWSRPLARRAIIGGGIGVAAASGAGGVLLATRRASPPPEPAGTVAGPPIRVVTTFTGKGKAKQLDHLALPLTLVVPSLDIAAPVVAVGLTTDGAMDVPRLPSDIGWYEYSPRPGLTGNSILAGHLNWQGTPAVFARLAEVTSGAPVLVRESDGDERRFAVEWKREVPAEAVPPRQVFEPITTPGLTLITCGGRYNPDTRRYDARIVVRALRK